MGIGIIVQNIVSIVSINEISKEKPSAVAQS